MKRYQTYKPSGIEWLGDIPAHWEVKRVKEIFRNTGSGTTPPSGDQTYYDDNGFNWLQTGDLNDSFITETSKKVSQKAIEEFSTLKKYRKNSLVIAMYGATIGKMGYLNIDTTTNQACCVLTNSKGNNSQYLFYQLLSMKQFIISLSTGGGQPNINQDIVRLLRLCVPDLHEQTAIANYLDTKTAAFDRKIELLTAKADKYKALRRSLINETVCRGLNPNVSLKDSGIEWIGMIPEHWEVKRVKDEINIINGFAFDSESYLDSGLPIIRIGDISNEIDFNEVKFISKENAIQAKYSRIKKYDILMAMTGATIGKNSYFQSDRAAYLNQRVCSFRVQNDSIPAFVKYYIESRFIQDLILLVSGGSAQDNISKYQLENFYIIIPPKNEQVEIANYLDSKTSKIDTILTNISEQITKLTQLRKTLINDVVTGKIKVTD